MAINVKGTAIQLNDDDSVSIESADLATLLVRHTETSSTEDDVLGLLRHHQANLTLEDIAIDDRGRVVIRGAEFRRSVAPIAGRADNGVCGINC